MALDGKHSRRSPTPPNNNSNFQEQDAPEFLRLPYTLATPSQLVNFGLTTIVEEFFLRSIDDFLKYFRKLNVKKSYKAEIVALNRLKENIKALNIDALGHQSEYSSRALKTVHLLKVINVWGHTHNKLVERIAHQLNKHQFRLDEGDSNWIDFFTANHQIPKHPLTNYWRELFLCKNVEGLSIIDFEECGGREGFSVDYTAMDSAQYRAWWLLRTIYKTEAKLCPVDTNEHKAEKDLTVKISLYCEAEYQRAKKFFYLQPARSIFDHLLEAVKFIPRTQQNILIKDLEKSLRVHRKSNQHTVLISASELDSFVYNEFRRLTDAMTVLGKWYDNNKTHMSSLLPGLHDINDPNLALELFSSSQYSLQWYLKEVAGKYERPHLINFYRERFLSLPTFLHYFYWNQFFNASLILENNGIAQVIQRFFNGEEKLATAPIEQALVAHQFLGDFYLFIALQYQFSLKNIKSEQLPGLNAWAELVLKSLSHYNLANAYLTKMTLSRSQQQTLVFSLMLQNYIKAELLLSAEITSTKQSIDNYIQALDAYLAASTLYKNKATKLKLPSDDVGVILMSQLQDTILQRLDEITRAFNKINVAASKEISTEERQHLLTNLHLEEQEPEIVSAFASELQEPKPKFQKNAKPELSPPSPSSTSETSEPSVTNPSSYNSSRSFSFSSTVTCSPQSTSSSSSRSRDVDAYLQPLWFLNLLKQLKQQAQQHIDCGRQKTAKVFHSLHADLKQQGVYYLEDCKSQDAASAQETLISRCYADIKAAELQVCHDEKAGVYLRNLGLFLVVLAIAFVFFEVSAVLLIESLGQFLSSLLSAGVSAGAGISGAACVNKQRRGHFLFFRSERRSSQFVELQEQLRDAENNTTETDEQVEEQFADDPTIGSAFT